MYELSFSAPTVAKALQHMVKLGMVHETTGKQRHRLFTYHRRLEILNRGTELPRTFHTGDHARDLFARDTGRAASRGGKRREARIWTQMDPSSGSYADYVRQSK